MTFVDSRKGEVVSGYKCTGHTKCETWARFALDDSQDWTQEQRREWQQLRDERQRQQQAQEMKKAEAALLLQERDIQYRELLATLTLDPEDRADLKRRGFTDLEIDLCGIKSVKCYQQLQKEFSHLLPGVSLDGKTLITEAGYLCPVRNVDNLIVSCQVRLRSVTSGGRYRWLSSRTKNNPLGQTPHVYGKGFAELPLSVHRPQDKPVGIALTEGTGVKPFKTSQRFSLIVVGAAGGQWASSPYTFERTLEKLLVELGGTKIITLFPDAGDVKNQLVTKRWRTVVNLLEGWGWSVRFGWWAQASKGDNDIDEILAENYPSIEYISTERFFGLCEKYGGTKPKNQPEWMDFKAKVAEAQKKLHTLSYASDIECAPHKKYLPNLVDRIPHKGIVLVRAAMGSGKSHQIKKIKQHLCGGFWEEKPIQSASQLSLIPQAPSNEEERVERIWHEGKNMKFITINARIALGREQAIRWEFTWLEDADLDQSQHYEHEGETIQTATVIETIEEIGLCWDSLGKLFERDWSNTLVIIDEIELGLNHVATSSTCRDRRSKILFTLEKKLNECLNGGGLIIGADANITDSTYEYLTKIAPGHIPFIVRHDYIRPPEDAWKIDFYTGKRDIVLSQIDDWLSDENCKAIAVAIDNQTEAEALANLLVKKYPWLKAETRGLIRIDSKVTQTDFGKNFVKRPNESLEKYQPKILIYTPSLGVGCSIDIDYFSYVFGLFFGNLEPSQARQMLARVRHPIPRIVWSKDRANNSESESSSFLPDEIKRQMFNYNDTTSTLIDTALYLAKERAADTNSDNELLPNLVTVLQEMMGKDGTWNNPHIDLFCGQRAKRNYSLSQLAVQLRQELADEGHNIEDISSEDKTDAGDNVRAENEEIKRRKSSATAQAPDITIEEAKIINRKPARTEEEECIATKAFLKDELPGIGLTQDFLYKAVYADNRRWLNQVKLFWMCFNIEATQELDKRHWKYRLKQFADGVAYLPDVKTFSGKVDAIHKSGIFEAINLDDFGRFYHEKDEVLQQWFTTKVLKHKKIIKAAFGTTVTKDTQIIKFVNRLLGRVGLRLKRNHKSNDVVYYVLDRELATDPDRELVMQALTRRWEQQTEQKPQENQEAIAYEETKLAVVQRLDVAVDNSNDAATLQQLPVPMTKEEMGQAEELAAELPSINDHETFGLMTSFLNPAVVVAAVRSLSTEIQDRLLVYCQHLKSLVCGNPSSFEMV